MQDLNWDEWVRTADLRLLRDPDGTVAVQQKYLRSVMMQDGGLMEEEQWRYLPIVESNYQEKE